MGCISVIYLCGALPLYGAMLWHNRIGADELVLSAFGLAPLWCGMRLGRGLRHHLGEQGFYRLMLAFLSVLSLALLLK